MRLAALFAVLLALAIGGAALAQPVDSDAEATVQYGLEAWGPLADGVELLVDNPDTPTARLEGLREELVGWRTFLLNAQDVNARRVSTIQAQLQGLGPAPDAGAGEAEPDAIANRRLVLTQELSEAQAPGLQAAESFREADGLISEIDSLIRARQTEALLEVGPSPIFPRNWDLALDGLVTYGRSLVSEVRTALSLPWRTAELRREAPLVAFLTALALLLLFRGRRWMTRLTQWVQEKGRSRGRIALGFVVSFGQVLVPFIGITLLATAVLSTQMFGDRGYQFIQGIVVVVLSAYGALWLVGRLFPAVSDFPAPFDVDDRYKRQARRRGLMVGVLIGMAALLRAMTEFEEIDRTVESVLALPIYVGLSVGYYALARTFRAAAAQVVDEDGPGFGLRLFGFASKALVFVAAIGPVLAMIGYHNLADALMMPTALSLGVLGFLLALQAPIRDFYAWATRTSLDDARAALLPVLINFFLVFATLPVLALVWGARPAELLELWSQLNEGISVGGTRLTMGAVFGVIIVFALGVGATRLFQGALKSTVLPRTKLDMGARNSVVSFAGYAGIGLSVLLAANTGGFDFTALAVIFGALSVGIGFGLQNIVQNFISGIILLVERPISEGDWVEVGPQMGIVKSISVRSTTIETFDRQQVIVPNGDFISGTVTNWTRGGQIGRAVVNVGVAYGTDTRRVEQILHECVEGVDYVAYYPPPGVDFMGFGADSLDFRIRAILTDVNQLVGVRTEIHHRIAERFAAEGIEIPFAQRDIWLRNPEALREQSNAAENTSDKRTQNPGGEAADDQSSD
ncbi:MAG: DUF3772 domain-containing protein [Pseudomonadota bacterium]